MYFLSPLFSNKQLAVLDDMIPVPPIDLIFHS